MEEYFRVRPLSGFSSIPTIYLAFVLLLLALVLRPAMVMHGPKLPEAETAVRLPDGATHVGLDGRGLMYLENGVFHEPAELATGLQEHFAGVAAEERVIYLSADSSNRYANVLNVVDAASAAGVTHVELLVDCPGRLPSHWNGCSRPVHPAGEPVAAPDAPRR